MSKAFDRLSNLVAKLRSSNGCPWDIKQTHNSLKPFLLEEAYELLEALDENDSQKLCEELGDLFLQILMHAQIEEENNQFTINEVIITLQEKLIRRHPHVFNKKEGERLPLTPNEVNNQWEIIKETERRDKTGNVSILDGVPEILPALLKASQIQKRVSHVGFDWLEPKEVLEKLHEELKELSTAVEMSILSNSYSHQNKGKQRDNENIEDEFGDVLFTIANLARFLNINPEEALRKSTNRFMKRFQFMEKKLNHKNKTMGNVTSNEWDILWEEAKHQENIEKLNQNI